MADIALQERIQRNIQIDDNGCWVWQLYIAKSNGYPHISVRRKDNLAHRISYQAFKGNIPNNLHVDHLCKVRACVNPKHLEAVTAQENVHRSNAKYKQQMARTHCPQGHEYSEDNTYIAPTRIGGKARSCKRCCYERTRIRQINKRLALQGAL